jgi:orotate phosphoribosyltransferase-like protein
MKYSAISAVPLAVLVAYQANAQVTVYTGVPSRTNSAAAAEETLNYDGLVSLTLTSNSSDMITLVLIDHGLTSRPTTPSPWKPLPHLKSL